MSKRHKKKRRKKVICVCGCRREIDIQHEKRYPHLQGYHAECLTQGMSSVTPKQARRDYKKYLRSGQWKLVRLQRLFLSAYKCERCGTAENLHVHHKTYARLGRERMKDLAVLCESCHADEHEDVCRPDHLSREFSEIARGFLLDL